MNYEQEIIQFLSKPENLSLVFEIADKVYQVRKKLHNEFWDFVINDLESKLRDSQFNKDWELEKSPDLCSSWSGVWFKPKYNVSDYHVFPRIEQWAASDLNIFYGLHQKNKNVTIIAQHVQEIIKILRKQGFVKQSDVWPAYRFMDIHPWTNDFFLRFAKGDRSQAKIVIDLFWDFFSKHALEIKEVNDSMPI